MTIVQNENAHGFAAEDKLDTKGPFLGKKVSDKSEPTVSGRAPSSLQKSILSFLNELETDLVTQSLKNCLTTVKTYSESIWAQEPKRSSSLFTPRFIAQREHLLEPVGKHEGDYENKHKYPAPSYEDLLGDVISVTYRF